MRTIRAVVADDERVIVRGLRKLLQWDELGIEIVGEAYDGDQLRTMISTHRPELVISDISMPGCTGIDIIKELNESKQNVQVVLISAYEEFSYAKDAVKYGAVDYLVKPIDKKQLEQVMHKVIRIISEQTEGVRHKEMAVRFQQDRRNETIGGLLDRLTEGDRSAAKRLSELGVMEGKGYVSVFLLELDERTDDTGRWQEQGRKLVDFAITNVLEEIVQNKGTALYFRKGERHGVLYQHEDDEHQAPFAEDIHQMIRHYLKLSVSIGVGKPAASIEVAAESYKQAAEALKSTYFEGLNRVFVYRPAMPIEEMKMNNRYKELQNKLVQALKASADEESSLVLEELLQTIRRLAAGSTHAAVSAVYSTFIIVQQELSLLDAALEISDETNLHLLERFSASSTFEQLKADAYYQLELMKVYVDARTSGMDMLQGVKVKKYMEEHYAENITLESLSEMFYMNPYYFSSFFKKHTGENFKTYLTNIRMKHAHSMLMQTNMLVYEIAERVGYNNARHFSNMFKKKYGKLPLEYKHSMKERQ